jgi:hypothetical protein
VHAATAHAVERLLDAFMRKWLDEVPSSVEQQERGLVAPFHDALVPGIRLLNERSFSTRLGNLHERVAELVAADEHGEVRRARDLRGTIPVLSREFITQRIAHLERRRAPPDAKFERQQFVAHFGGEVEAATRIDLWLRARDGSEHFFEIKSGKPNKGQCIEMKERLLTAFAIARTEDAYWWWGVPYNPYGTSSYTHAYALPFFDFTNEVMLGERFWEFVGGMGTFDSLLDVFAHVGEQYAPEIERLRAA